MEHRPCGGLPGPSRGPCLVLPGLQTLQQGQRSRSGGPEDSRPCVGSPPLGRDGPSPRHHRRKCGGVPDVGTCTPGEARPQAGGDNFPAVAGPTAGPRIHRGLPGTGSGGLWRTHHPQAVCAGGAVRWATGGVARADTQPEREQRTEEVGVRKSSTGRNRPGPSSPPGRN